ncbi:hypothetical protein ODS41_13115 [Pyrobaculum sp. 3827-6]|uniref:hypothetical protein n=1 Tax=Pyrobaculum sp. 3827-6 TaxID=2983604 RepID=UPI0021D847AF|nr:hypothetical protein [Pyrobaculum sp. 3827-6]MCU7788852.1 hypothetical protein [Pyrobaculum sp. 3827-6]
MKIWDCRKAEWGEYCFTTVEEILKVKAKDVVRGPLRSDRARQAWLVVESLKIGIDTAVLVEGDPPIRFAPMQKASRAGLVLKPKPERRGEVLAMLLDAYVATGLIGIYDVDLDALSEEPIYTEKGVREAEEMLNRLRKAVAGGGGAPAGPVAGGDGAGEGLGEAGAGGGAAGDAGAAGGGVRGGSRRLAPLDDPVERLRWTNPEMYKALGRVLTSVLRLLEVLGEEGVAKLAERAHQLKQWLEA